MGRRHIVTAALAAAAAIVLGSGAQAATIVGGSDLLDAAGAAQIETWLGQGPVTFTNIFDKTTGDTASDFHAAVDGKGPTVFLAQVSGAFGSAVIGGYDPVSWDQNLGDFVLTPDPADRTAFVFNLTSSTYFPQNSGPLGEYQTFDYPSYGPVFGGSDLVVYGDLSGGFAQAYSYCPVGVSACLSTATLFPSTGATSFSVGAFETFSVSSTVTPIPATLPLFISALGGLGFVGYRRRAA
jgi:hypothetical protein